MKLPFVYISPNVVHISSASGISTFSIVNVVKILWALQIFVASLLFLSFFLFLQPFKNIKTIVSRRTIVYSLLMPTLKSLEDQVGIGGEDQEGRDKNDIKILSRQVGGGRNTKILTNMYCLFTLQQDVAKPLASTFSLSFNNGLMNCLLLLEPF